MVWDHLQQSLRLVLSAELCIDLQENIMTAAATAAMRRCDFAWLADGSTLGPLRMQDSVRAGPRRKQGGAHARVRLAVALVPGGLGWLC